MTLTHTARRTEHESFAGLYAGLDLHQRSMYEALREDVLEAKRRSSKWGGLINCSGWFHFVILRECVEFPRGLAYRGKIESKLKLNPDAGVTHEVVVKLLKVLKAEGIARIEPLRPCHEAAFEGVKDEAFEFVVDTKSA